MPMNFKFRFIALDNIRRLILCKGDRRPSDNAKNPVAEDQGAVSPAPAEISSNKLQKNAPTINKNSAGKPSVTTIRAPGSSVLESLGIALVGLEMVLHKFPELRSLIAGIRICVVSTEYNQITEKIQREYDDIALNLIGLAYKMRYVFTLGKEIDPVKLHSTVRGIRQAIIRIKIRREQSSMKIPDSDIEQEIRRYHSIIKLLSQLLEFQTTWKPESFSMVLLMAYFVKRAGFPVYNAHYKAAWWTESLRHEHTTKVHLNTLNILKEWRQSFEGPRIFWMTGGTGTGKTAIAYSICEQFDYENSLGASFFCSNTTDVNQIIPTIAYQLAHFSSEYSNTLFKSLLESDTIERNMSDQFDQLLAIPFRINGKRRNRLVLGDAAIVIDALDQCLNVTGVWELLELLYRYKDRLPVKFILTSRPSILAHPMSPFRGTPTLVQLHDIQDSYMPNVIQLYLGTILSPVVPHDSIQKLCALACDEFIFATTAARFILPGHEVVDSGQRLSVILENMTNLSDTSYAALDRLYTMILSNALEDNSMEAARSRQLVLWTVVFAESPWTTMALAELLDLASQEVIISAILPLWSVLDLNSIDGSIFLRHASFREFLLDPKRSGKYHCNLAEHSELLANRCFKIMRRSLQFNICNLATSSQLDDEVPDLFYRVEKAIPSVLFYACCNWSKHLEKAQPSSPLTDNLDNFLRLRLLFWMEVLNLKKCIDWAQVILLRALGWLAQVPEMTELYKLVKDAHDFVKTYGTSAASKSTPHIYISALPFVSAESRIYTTYCSQMRGLPAFAVRGTQESPEREVNVASTALSLDGAQVAIGTKEGIICIWDIRGGSLLLGPITISTEAAIGSIAFSPDSARIVSGSSDGVVRTWDPNTGLGLVSMSTAHRSRIVSVTFLPGGSEILSCSNDGSIQTYDSHTGLLLDDNQVCSHSVISAMFSPDGSYVLLNHSKGWLPIRLHKLKNSELPDRLTFDGHVQAVSPDGRRVALNPIDREGIIVQDIYSGTQLEGQFQKHNNRILCTSFSADGKRMVSGFAHDRSIRIWDAYEGKPLLSPLWEPQNVSHAIAIKSVAFSPSGDHVISDCGDGMICLWNLEDSVRHCSVQDPHTWKMDDDGWLRDSNSRLVLWLPEDRREDLLVVLPPCPLIIGYEGAILEIPNDILIGERWCECYVGSSGSEGV
ncbi:unnamed protein product [Rhizoctonia solani]|nr:unnamed protein product [Rhizoctonia solani]